MIGLLLGVQDKGTSQKNAVPQTYCFDYFPRSFVVLFSIVLRQVCLLHQVGADDCNLS